MALNDTPAKAAPSDALRLHRGWLLALVLTLPLAAALAAFASVQRGAPAWPEALIELPARGALLAADGTVLADGPAEARQYPHGSLAAPLLGFTGAVQPDGRFGLEGLEYTLDARLQTGEAVRLTIDPAMQAVAEAHVAESVRATEAENGAAVILEVASGRVLAAASYPSFDANAWRSADREAMQNRPFLQHYEPGSIIKPFVVAALLESGRIRPDAVVDAPMHLRVGNKTFRDVVSHDPQLSVADVLRYSSNSGTINLATMLESAELHAWLAAFGFGQELPLRSTFTRRGQLNAWETWVPQDHATISIGHSIATTALQMAAAYAIIANDGRYVPPRVVEDEPVPAGHRVLSPEVAMTVRHMLQYTVEASSLRQNSIPGVPFAGKTGTGDIFDAEANAYLPGDYTLSFAGMFPAERPEVVIVVYVQKPRTLTSSTLVAAPLFRAIASEVVARWGIAPGERIEASLE